MDSVRSRSDHASDTREPAPGSKSLFPLYEESEKKIKNMKIENFFFSIFDFVRFLKKVPLNLISDLNGFYLVHFLIIFIFLNEILRKVYNDF